MGITKSHLSELRAWQKRTGTKWQTVAKALGVSKTTISLYLKGQRHLSLDAVETLASLTGVPVEKLLTSAEATGIMKLLGKRLNSPSRKVRDNANVA